MKDMNFLKDTYNKLCREYQEVLAMSEEEVQRVHEETKAECNAAYEHEIDYWARECGY